MAEFNPAPPPTQDPNFSFLSRPIQEPRPNVSGETLLAGTGKAVGEAVGAANQFVEKGLIQPQVEKEAGDIRDSFVDALNTARASMASPSSAADHPMSLIGGAGPYNVPTAVGNLSHTAETLQGALDSGKISETYYYGQLNSLAKNLRAQYPGYRDYVDQELARVTGVHPANTYIRSLITDLNRMGEQKTSQIDKDLALGRDGIKEGIPHMADMMDGLKSGKVSSSEFNHYYNDSMAFKYKSAADDAAHKSQTNTREDDARYYTTKNNGVADWLVSNAMQMPFTLAGHTPGSVQELAERQGRGEKFEDADWTTLGQNYNVLKTRSELELRKFLSTDAGEGITNADPMAMSPTEQEDWIKSKLGPIDSTLKSINDKDLGLMNGHAMLNKAIMTDIQNNKFISDPDNARVSATLDWIHKVAPEMVPLLTEQFVVNMNSGVGGWLDVKQFNAAATPGAPKGFFHTLFGDITEGQQKKIQDADAYRKLLTGLSDLTNPGVPNEVKSNYAHYFFDGNTHQLMTGGVFKEDTVDRFGNKVEGKYKAYSGLFNAATANSMWKLQKDVNDPNLWQKYENSARENGFVLFRDKMKDLTDLQNNPTVQGIHFAYHTDKDGSKLQLIGADGKPIERLAPGDVTAKHGNLTLQDSVDKINIMLKSLREVARPAHADIDGFLVDSLSRMGFDPTKTTGIPSQIMRAILASRSGPGPKDMKEALHGEFDPSG